LDSVDDVAKRRASGKRASRASGRAQDPSSSRVFPGYGRSFAAAVFVLLGL